MLRRLKPGVFIASVDEADWFKVLIRDSAAHIQTLVTGPPGDPVALVERLVLDQATPHTAPEQEQDLAEQISLTWTWLVAIAAARLLLHLHPDSEGLHLTPSGPPSRRNHEQPIWLAMIRGKFCQKFVVRNARGRGESGLLANFEADVLGDAGCRGNSLKVFGDI